jgi:uncharacterized metal-binding protein
MSSRIGQIRVNKIHDGNVHFAIGRYFTDAIIALFLLIGFVASLYFKWDFLPILSKLGLAWIGSQLATAYVSPDLDLHKSVPKRKWGHFGFLWEPYRLFIAKSHRGILSHGLQPPLKWRRYPKRVFAFKWFGFILGTCTRIVYLISIAIIACIILDWVVGVTLFTDVTLKFILSEIMLWLCVGVCLSDGIHTRYDLLTTKKRRDG